MAYSNKLLEAALSENTSEVFLILLTFNHETFDKPIYMVNNVEDIISRGNSFMAFPFNLSLPLDDGDSLPAVSIQCENASLELIDELRKLTSPLSVTLEMILASSPDYVETSIDDMRVAAIQYDKQNLTLTATVDDLLNTSFPKERYLPSNFAGLFK
jgi:hypothetical protein